mgnify:CR=1 FL=1
MIYKRQILHETTSWLEHISYDSTSTSTLYTVNHASVHNVTHQRNSPSINKVTHNEVDLESWGEKEINEQRAKEPDI